MCDQCLLQVQPPLPHLKPSGVYKHLHSHHWHQLNLIIIRCTDLTSVLLTCSYHSADCDTDQYLFNSRVRVAPKTIDHSKKGMSTHQHLLCRQLRENNNLTASCKKPSLTERLKTSLMPSGSTFEMPCTTLPAGGEESVKKPIDTRQVIDTYTTKTAPFKSKFGEITTDQGKRLQSWVVHYLELYFKPK